MIRRAAWMAIVLSILGGMAMADNGRVHGLGKICGGIAGFTCRQGLWCDGEPGACGHPDWAGTCIAVSQVCTREYRPVCGCDGKTYANDCERRSRKAAKRQDGAC